MDGLALHVDRSHTGGGEHDQALGRRRTEILQQCGFAGARTAGEKHGGPRLLQQPEHVSRLGMQRHPGFGHAPLAETLPVWSMRGVAVHRVF